MKAAGNFLDAVAKPTMITIDQWLARRAELQNKPSWNASKRRPKPWLLVAVLRSWSSKPNK